MRRPVRRRRAGFTLIELLVSVAMLGIIMVYLLRSFTVQHRTYTVVDETTELQQNARAVADLLERDLRHAGMLVPESGAVCGVDDTNGPDILFVSDADAISPGTEKVADFGADTTATTVAASATETLTVDGLVAEPSPPRPAYDTDGDGDALVDANEYRGVAGVAYDASDAAIDENEIREVRVNLVLRTRFEDPTWTQGVFQNLENRTAVAGTDGFRRRIHTASVRLRNTGNR